jgi:7-carboxy-7-deazaguanine synthase
MQSNSSNSKYQMNANELPVMEQFYTLQGEGYFHGQAAYFIRLAGCDVGCVWCDVKESWDAEKHPIKTIDEIIAGVKSSPARICVVTGGEPLLYDLTNLTKALHEAGLQTNIETSASSAFSGTWDWVCISPKKFKAPLTENMPLANELKIVVFHKSDIEWAEKYAAMVSAECKLYLQPEWDKANEISPLIIEYIKLHPQWQLSLQSHKYLNIP